MRVPSVTSTYTVPFADGAHVVALPDASNAARFDRASTSPE